MSALDVSRYFDDVEDFVSATNPYKESPLLGKVVNSLTQAYSQLLQEWSARPSVDELQAILSAMNAVHTELHELISIHERCSVAASSVEGYEEKLLIGVKSRLAAVITHRNNSINGWRADMAARSLSEKDFAGLCQRHQKCLQALQWIDGQIHGPKPLARQPASAFQPQG